jgi:uncharacterized membrane protein
MYLRRIGVGHLFFALGFAVIGAISFVARDFLLFQQPVPPQIPWRETLACISAALMLVPGLGMLYPATAARSTLILTAFVALWVLALQIPRALAHPLVEVNWLGVGEDTTMAAGGWLIYCGLAGRSDAGIRTARTLFGLALVPIGLSHFFYLQPAVGMIPTWMPLRAPLTLLSGAGHIAAGLAIMVGVVPRLAATMEAGMQSLITIICWVSAVIGTPASRTDWVTLCISITITAAAWAVAQSYGRLGEIKPTAQR